MRDCFRLRCGLVWLCCLTAGWSGAQEMRVWTNQEQRTVEAALEGVVDGKVKLRLRNGAAAEVALATLSAGDQQWVEAWKAKQAAAAPGAAAPAGGGTPGTAAAGAYAGPAAGKEWPRTVALDEKGGATVIEEDDVKKVFRYESDHYEFVCDSRIGVSAVREFSKVFEATWLVNCLLPLDLKPMPERLRTKFLARIYTSRDDYRAEGGTEGSAGVYSSGKKMLMLPLTSLGVKMVGSRVSVDYGSENYRTLIHEITHQMMTHWLPRIPTWYTEGSAEYVELAEYSNGRFSFGQHEKRLGEHLQRYGVEFALVPMEKLMTIEGREWSEALLLKNNTNYPSALALTYFFYHVDGDGKGTHLMAYLRELEGMERPSKEAVKQVEQTHLMRERSYADLEEEVRKWLRKAGVKVADMK
jgi:hypothetical protein